MIPILSLVPLRAWLIGGAVAATVAGGWYAKSSYDERKRNEGRAEVRVEFDAYKLRVQQATADAYASVNKASIAVSQITESIVYDHRARVRGLETANADTQKAIDRAALPDCRIDDGLRDALNAARARAATTIDDAYRASRAVSETDRAARQPREPRR